MTVEADLYSAVQSLVGGRVFPDVAPFGTAKPYITFQQVGGEAVSFLESTLPSVKNGRFMFKVWAGSRLEAAALALQVEAALVISIAFSARPEGAPVAVSETDTEMVLYGTVQDFNVWSNR